MARLGLVELGLELSHPLPVGPSCGVVEDLPQRGFVHGGARQIQAVDLAAGLGQEAGEILQTLRGLQVGAAVRVLDLPQLARAPECGAARRGRGERLAAPLRARAAQRAPGETHGLPHGRGRLFRRYGREMQLPSLSTIYVLSFGDLPLTALLRMRSFFVRFEGLVGAASSWTSSSRGSSRTPRRHAAVPYGSCCAR